MAASNHFRRGTVECYDCHQQVADLKAHRSVCPSSRRAKSFVGPAASVASSRKPSFKNKPVDIRDRIDHYFLLDVSGSMAGSRLKESKDIFSSIFQDLKEEDRMAIISFDTHAYFKLKPRPVGEIKRKGELPGILDRIFAEGRTALYDAIQLAVTQIRDKEVRTVINVLTDGEDNSSHITLDAVEAMVEQYPKITLNIIHIGSTPNPPYQKLCETRGQYHLITQVDLSITLKSVFFQI